MQGDVGGIWGHGDGEPNIPPGAIPRTYVQPHGGWNGTFLGGCTASSSALMASRGPTSRVDAAGSRRG